MKKSRVQLVTEASGGGVLTHIAEITQLLKDDVEFTFVYLRRSDSPSDDEIQHLVGMHVHLVSLQVQKTSKRQFACAVWRTCANFRPDIVHLHSTQAGLIGKLVVRCMKNPKMRLLYSPHCFGFLRKDVHPVIRRTIWLIEWFTKFRSRCELVAVSQYEADIGSRLGYSVIHKISNTVIGLANARTQPSLSKQACYRVAMLGRVSAQKDPALFVSIASRVCSVMKDVEFVWIGGGDMEDELGQLIEVAGLRTRVRVTGLLTHERALEFLSQADVYLHTALWEAQPIAILEAMALGKPVIVRNFPGVREMVRQGTNGYLYNTIADGAEKMVQMLRTPSEMESFGRKSHEFFIERHSPEIFKASLLHIYGG